MHARVRVIVCMCVWAYLPAEVRARTIVCVEMCERMKPLRISDRKKILTCQWKPFGIFLASVCVHLATSLLTGHVHCDGCRERMRMNVLTMQVHLTIISIAYPSDTMYFWRRYHRNRSSITPALWRYSFQFIPIPQNFLIFHYIYSVTCVSLYLQFLLSASR